MGLKNSRPREVTRTNSASGVSVQKKPRNSDSFFLQKKKEKGLEERKKERKSYLQCILFRDLERVSILSISIY